MERNDVKIIISGLDNAGKTSILTALNKKYDFQKAIMELKPTIRIEYHKMSFLGNSVMLWDMGGQEKYRKVYQKRQEIYFDDTDLLLYIIDIQDKERIEESLNYLDMVLQFFLKHDIDTPLIVSFHKFDPEIRGDEELNNRIEGLREKLLEKYPTIKILFQQTSIYDLISIIQLISYGLSVFDEKFFDLSELLEAYVDEFDCSSLILFDESGIIISEFYSDEIDPELYIKLLESIKEHLFLLKRMQEEKDTEHNFYNIEANILSYLHSFKIGEYHFFISVIIREELRENLLEIFSEFLEDVIKILNSVIT